MKGIIYIRVSSEEQVKGTSLEFQEESCRKYCKDKSIEVIKVFKEEGASAKSTDRKEFLDAINFCGINKGNIEAFIVFKVDRFARNTEDHFAVRKILGDYKVTLHSVTENIGNDPSQKFMETLLAASAEFDNTIRTKRSTDGMSQRINQGIWPWKCPPGYKSLGSKKMGEKKTKPDPVDEQVFPIIQKCLKDYARGLFNSQTEFRIALDKHGLARIRGNATTKSIVSNILGRYLRFYAGWLYNPWTEKEIRGLHMPMINDEEYQNIVLICSGKIKKFKRNNANPEFTLCGTVFCDHCKEKITGSTSRGNGGLYSYYHCKNKNCPLFGRTIKKDVIEKEFLHMLGKVTPKSKFLEVFKETVLDLWKEKGESLESERGKYEKQLAVLTEKRKKVFDMLENGSYTREDFQERKVEIDNEIIATKISMSECNIDKLDVEGVLTFATNFINNLGRQWFELSTEIRPRFQKLVFPEGIPYIRGEGFGTAKLGLIYEQNRGFDPKLSLLVPPPGLEPGTKCLKGTCSAN